MPPLEALPSLHQTVATCRKACRSMGLLPGPRRPLLEDWKPWTQPLMNLVRCPLLEEAMDLDLRSKSYLRRILPGALRSRKPWTRTTANPAFDEEATARARVEDPTFDECCTSMPGPVPCVATAFASSFGATSMSTATARAHVEDNQQCQGMLGTRVLLVGEVM
jgi:hypothetical protein